MFRGEIAAPKVVSLVRPAVVFVGGAERSGKGGGYLARLQPERLVDESRVIRFGTGCRMCLCVRAVARSVFLCFVW